MLRNGWSVLVAVCFLMALSPVAIGADGKPGMTVGLGSLPTIGWTRFNENGQLVAVTGFNLGLGYSARYFRTEDGLQPDRFNNYWGWGTVALIIPYIEFGWLYAMPMGSKGGLFVIDLGFIYILPHIGLGFYF